MAADRATGAVRIAGATDTGRRRPENQDAMDWRLAPDGASAVAVVADGVGGRPGGARASGLAVNAVVDRFDGGWPDSPDAVDRSLQEAVAAANRSIRGARDADPKYAQMATTLIVAAARAAGVALAHVGDSRAYHYRTGVLSRLTRDHTVAQQMVDDGVLRPEQLDRVPYANVLSRAVGAAETVEAAFNTTSWQPGDRVLLCSDGLNAALAEDTIAAVLAEPDLAGAAARLIDESNRAGAPDNVTVLLLEPQ